MYCRNCGNQVSEHAVVCIACGVPPLLGDRYCYNCKGETAADAQICLKCGVSLANNAAAKTTAMPRASVPNITPTTKNTPSSQTGDVSNRPATKQHWYDKNLGLVYALCLLFFPVGLYGLWKSSVIKKTTKQWVTGRLVAMYFIGMVMEPSKHSIYGKYTSRDENKDNYIEINKDGSVLQHSNSAYGVWDAYGSYDKIDSVDDSTYRIRVVRKPQRANNFAPTSDEIDLYDTEDGMVLSCGFARYAKWE